MKPTVAALFRHCPACGSATGENGDGPRFDCAACGFVFHFNPASGVAAFLVDRQDRILFIRRQHEPSRGRLDLPGGFIEFHERAEEALRREVREEIGLEVGALSFLATHPNIYPYKGIVYSVTDLFFVGRVDSFDDARPLSEVTELAFLRRREIDPASFAFPSLHAAWKDFLLSEG